MSSDDLFPQSKDPKSQWEALESRVNRLMEAIVQLRNANGQIMKENVILKNQLKEKGDSPNGSSEELARLKQKYAEAMEDLKTVKTNLHRIEGLANQLKLDENLVSPDKKS